LSGSRDLPHDPAASGPAASGLPVPPVPASAASGQAAPRPGLINVANELTLLRLVMVPFFVVFLAMAGWPGSGA
jgi:hypothetical protein